MEHPDQSPDMWLFILQLLILHIGRMVPQASWGSRVHASTGSTRPTPWTANEG